MEKSEQPETNLVISSIFFQCTCHYWKCLIRSTFFAEGASIFVRKKTLKYQKLEKKLKKDEKFPIDAKSLPVMLQV